MEFLHHKGIKVELKIARAAMVVCIHNQYTHSYAWATQCTFCICVYSIRKRL